MESIILTGNLINNSKEKHTNFKTNFLYKKIIKPFKNKFIVNNYNRSRTFYSMFYIVLRNKVKRKKFKLIRKKIKNNKSIYLYIKMLNFFNIGLLKKKNKKLLYNKYLKFIRSYEKLIISGYSNNIINNINTYFNKPLLNNNNNTFPCHKLMKNNNDKKNIFYYYYLKIIIFNNIIIKNYKHKHFIFKVTNFFNKTSRLINIFYRILYSINNHSLEDREYYYSNINTFRLGFNTQVNKIIDYSDVIRFSGNFNTYNGNNRLKKQEKISKTYYSNKEISYYIDFLKRDLTGIYSFTIKPFIDINKNNLYYKLFLNKDNNNILNNKVYTYYNYLDWLKYNLEDLRSLDKEKSYTNRKTLIEYDICIKPRILKLLKLMEEEAKKKKKSV
jgi:hypothetical protein